MTARIPRGRPKAWRPLNVLLAEDNVITQREAVELLTRRGHSVTVAGSGFEALVALERAKGRPHGQSQDVIDVVFDVVLMDLQMPLMGGFEATAEIRRREREIGGHIRIVAMTAHAKSGDREQCLAAGMDAYVPKPIEPAALYAALEAETGAASVSCAPIAPAAPPRPIDRASAMQRMGGDHALFAEVSRLFLEDCPARLAAIRAAVDDGDAERIRETAHALKGAAGSMSATGLYEATASLERIGAEGQLPAAREAWRHVESEAAAAMQALRNFETPEITP